MKERLLAAILLLCLCACQSRPAFENVPEGPGDLCFPALAGTWDEAIPLGNATVGALIWQKGSRLRVSLDRVDLWDLRSSDSLSGPNYSFEWVMRHVREGNYKPVQDKMDAPYDNLPAPSKIPGAALEFPTDQLGQAVEVRLFLNSALCRVRWSSGAVLWSFVNAEEPVGWFIIEQAPEGFCPTLEMPAYETPDGSGAMNPVEGQDLRRLGYSQGTVQAGERSLLYHQPGHGDFSYDVAVQWQRTGETLAGCWSISSSLGQEDAQKVVEKAMKEGCSKQFDRHARFWARYWAQSGVTLPDSLLQRQYDNEMYKFGSAAREHSYPISLQAVWTADNGQLPPWKGDFHHDLNTQLSYWPAYTGNHLQEGLGYLNTLWNQQDVYKAYTKEYFHKDGLNVPGVCTLEGKAMGGWIQYSLSQTVSAWLAQHFYLHWKYSADREFLRDRAYPFIREVAVFLEQQTTLREGVRTLEYSSSPEIFDNSLQAWFPTITNFELSLITFLFRAAAELAHELSLPADAAHWEALAAQLPPLSVDGEGALTFAEGFPYNVSHRHFSHALAIYPLGLLDWSHGADEQRIIRATLDRLHQVGPQWWTGYTYSWLGNLEARALNGDAAYEALKTFATCFCLSNTFHVNGDQSGTGKSGYTYRPFTLEGNMAFASGIQEMLLQSHSGVIRVFPAIPSHWKEVSFRKLRARGAFLVSAEMRGGEVAFIEVYSEQGGTLKLLSPLDGTVITRPMKPGETFRWAR